MVAKSKRTEHPSIGVLIRRCTENMQQIYRITPMSMCDFTKLLCNFIEIALQHGCSAENLLHISRTPFPKNTSGGLLLKEYSAKIRGFTYSRPKFVKKLEQTNGGHPTGSYLLKVNNRNSRKKVRDTLQANNKNTRAKSMTSFWCFYC